MQKIQIKNKKGFTQHQKTSKKFFGAGFTLVETLVYVAIFTMFVSSLVAFSGSMSRSRAHNQMMLEVNDQGANVMKVITASIRNAHSINSPTIASSASNLSIVTESPSTSPTVFSENSGVLYITEGSSSPVALTNNKVVLSGLLFSNFSRVDTPDIIKVSFTLASSNTSSNSAGTYSFTFNGSASLRK